MKSINSDQDDILKTLTGIEKEIDVLIGQGGDRYAFTKSSNLIDFYNDPITSVKALEEATSPYETRVTRQQIFQKAFFIDQYTDDIQSELNLVQR